MTQSDLVVENARLRSLLRDIEQWEADWVDADECWRTDSGLPILNQELYDRWCNQPDCLQQRRYDLLSQTPNPDPIQREDERLRAELDESRAFLMALHTRVMARPLSIELQESITRHLEKQGYTFEWNPEIGYVMTGRPEALSTTNLLDSVGREGEQP